MNETNQQEGMNDMKNFARGERVLSRIVAGELGTVSYVAPEGFATVNWDDDTRCTVGINEIEKI